MWEINKRWIISSEIQTECLKLRAELQVFIILFQTRAASQLNAADPASVCGPDADLSPKLNQSVESSSVTDRKPERSPESWTDVVSAALSSSESCWHTTTLTDTASLCVDVKFRVSFNRLKHTHTHTVSVRLCDVLNVSCFFSEVFHCQDDEFCLFTSCFLMSQRKQIFVLKFSPVVSGGQAGRGLFSEL